MRIFRLIIFSLLMGFSVSVVADTYSAKINYYIFSSSVEYRYPSKDAACNHAKSVYSASNYTVTGSGFPYSCKLYNSGGGLLQSLSIYYIPTCPYGGTASGSYPEQCINAPACPTGQTRDSVTGECGIVCPAAGTQKVLGVQDFAGKSTAPAGEMVITIDDSASSPHTVIMGGCEYTYSAGDFAGKCYTSASAVAVDGVKPVTCEYTATSTGNKSPNPTDPSTAIDPDTEKPSDAADTPNAQPDCVTDSRGNTTCRSNPEANKKCGTVNGVKVCVDTTTGTGTVNGQPYTPSDKNCGYVNGKPVCVSTTGSGEIASTQGCLKNGSVVHCVNSDIKTETVEGPTVANPDGTTTKTKTTESNEIGSTPEVTTTTTGTDGTTTTTTTGGSGSGKGNGDRDIKTDCDKYPDSIGCQTLKEASGNEGGALTTESMDIGINANSSWGSGSCPAPKQLNLQTVGGKSWSYQPVCDFMGYMRPVLIAFGWLIGAFIVLS